MTFSPQVQLLGARVRLLNMAVYSDTMLKIVSVGLKHAIEDPHFFQNQIRDAFPHLTAETVCEVAELNKELDIDQALDGAKGAALIFTHAGVEACLDDLAELIAGIEPKDFLPLLAQRQVTLEQVFASGSDATLREHIERYLVSLRRMSLVDKTRALFRIIRSAPVGAIVFEEARVERIERLRNDCAHGRIGVADFTTLYDDLSYLRDVADYFIDAIAARYKVPYQKISEQDLRPK